MSAPEDRRHNAAQLRVLQVIEVLSGNEVFGMRLTDIAKAMRTPAPTTLRDLQAAEAGGWTQQLEDGKWRLAAKAIQTLTNFQFGLQSAAHKVDEVKQRYTRLPG